MGNDISLEKYSPTVVTLKELENYVLSDPKYTIHPQEKVMQIVGDARHVPVLIRKSEGTLVGFFCLSSWPENQRYTNNEKAILFGSLSIDERYRGKGYAKAALLLLPKVVKTWYPKCDEIVLGVNHNNKAAQMLYLATGFSDDGQRLMGILGMQHVLSYKWSN